MRAQLKGNQQGFPVLFAGANGTGKTMAAIAMAKSLGIPMHRMDSSRVVSMYIGETEKNLARLFAAAEIDGKYPLEALRPCHRRQWLVAIHPALWSLRDRLRPKFGVGGEYPVKAGEIEPGTWHQGCKPCDEIQRFQNHMRRPIPERTFVAIDDSAPVIDRPPFGGNGRKFSLRCAIQMKRSMRLPIAGPTPKGDYVMRLTTPPAGAM